MIQKSKVFHLFLIALCLYFYQSKAEDYSEVVISGFVELSQESAHEENIDFSKIEILLTSDNRVIDKTSCAQNGFFMIPVYDKKAYVLKVQPPQESIFEPSSIVVDLKDKSAEKIREITEQSFIFKFVGFSITGKVSVENSGKGPSNVRVEIFDAKNKKISETVTENGKFRFDKILTGKYTIRPTEGQKGYAFKQGHKEINCEITWKKGQQCTGEILISGYDVTGSFFNFNQNLKNAIVFLYPSDKQAKISIPCSQPEIKHPLSSENRKYLCYAKPGEKGEFTFREVPSGEYFLKVDGSSVEGGVEIIPSTYNFAVKEEQVNLQNIFKVDKFSIRGRIVDQQGNGISGVKIMLDGEEKTISDSNGYYSLEKLSSGSYTIEGQHDHLFFEPITNIKIDPTTEKLPNLVLSYIHVCGKVSLSNSPSDTEFKNAKVVIYLEKQGEKRSVPLEKNGTYCFEVQPGKYILYPLVSNIPNVKQDSLLYPRMYEIHATNQPLLEMNFNRPRLFVQGSVKTLGNVDKAQLTKTVVYLTSKAKNLSEKVSLNKDGRFEFNNVLPGSYEVRIESSNMCWEEDSKTLDLSSSNVTDLSFVQQGFAFRYKTNRPIKAKLQGPGSETLESVLEPSKDKYCVKKSGEYTLIPDECYQFSKKTFTVRTDNDQPTEIIPVGFLLKGQVIVNESIGENLKNESLTKFIENNILVSVSLAKEQKVLDVLKLKQVASEKGILKFAYSLYITPNTEVIIEAKPKDKIEGGAASFIQNLLFNPTQQRIHIKDNCVIDTQETKIEVRQGVIFVGEVLPALDNWKLSIFKENEDGSKQLVHSMDVKNARFRAGPFADFYKYDIQAEKSGYKFEPEVTLGGHNLYKVVFRAHKLSHLEIFMKDEEGKPVPGALIFISSTSKKNFLKINNYTDENGVFATQHLVKGEYFVRAVLKEYNFEPAQSTITIEDGEHKKIAIKAKRVAYSAFGRIHNLNMKGCEGLTVKAVAIDSNAPIETATTDEQGLFRIRGLIPNTQYHISVENSSKYSSVKPEVFNIKAQAKDIFDIDFIGFERKDDFIITGNVEFDDTFSKTDIEQIESIQVKLFREGEAEAVDSVSFRLFRYFEFKNVKKGNYILRASVRRSNSLAISEYEERISETSFGEEAKVAVTIKISKDSSKAASSALKSSFFGPIAILSVIFMFFNMDSISRWYKNYNQKTTTAPSKKRN